jgi:hypothetical protein
MALLYTEIVLTKPGKWGNCCWSRDWVFTWPVDQVIVSLLAVASLVVAIFLYWRHASAAALPTNNPAEIYDTAVSDQLYAPVYLHIDPMAGLLLVNFENDPDEIYIGFEPQLFDDDSHGQGLIVIAWRVDGRLAI